MRIGTAFTRQSEIKWRRRKTFFIPHFGILYPKGIILSYCWRISECGRHALFWLLSCAMQRWESCLMNPCAFFGQNEMGDNPPLWLAHNHNSHRLETKNPVFSCPYLTGMLPSVETEMLCVTIIAHFSGAMPRSLKFPWALTTHNSTATFFPAGREARGTWHRHPKPSFPPSGGTWRAPSLHLPIPQLLPWLHDTLNRLKKFPLFTYVLSQHPQSYAAIRHHLKVKGLRLRRVRSHPGSHSP